MDEIQQPAAPEAPVSPPPPQPAGPQQPPAAQPTDGLGIASIILFFFFPLVGLILGIIGMSKAKKAGRKNTLSLVGVVLNALGVAFWTLIIAGFVFLLGNSNVQAAARDVERKKDIMAIGLAL